MYPSKSGMWAGERAVITAIIATKALQPGWEVAYRLSVLEQFTALNEEDVLLSWRRNLLLLPARGNSEKSMYSPDRILAAIFLEILGIPWPRKIIVDALAGGTCNYANGGGVLSCSNLCTPLQRLEIAPPPNRSTLV